MIVRSAPYSRSNGGTRGEGFFFFFQTKFLLLVLTSASALTRCFFTSSTSCSLLPKVCCNSVIFASLCRKVSSNDAESRKATANSPRSTLTPSTRDLGVGDELDNEDLGLTINEASKEEGGKSSENLLPRKNAKSDAIVVKRGKLYELITPVYPKVATRLDI